MGSFRGTLLRSLSRTQWQVGKQPAKFRALPFRKNVLTRNVNNTMYFVPKTMRYRLPHDTKYNNWLASQSSIHPPAHQHNLHDLSWSDAPRWCAIWVFFPMFIFLFHSSLACWCFLKWFTYFVCFGFSFEWFFGLSYFWSLIIALKWKSKCNLMAVFFYYLFH